MAWRFRKRFQILPGVKLNISKSGLSATVEKKGASVNITKNSAYLNTGIPGTGLYRRDKISSNTMKKVEKADNYREPSFFFQDCVDENYNVKLWLDTPLFIFNPMPPSVKSYKSWIDKELDFVNKRGKRIKDYLKMFV